MDIDGETVFRCPRRPILENPRLWNEIFFLYSSYKQGFLPEAGGLNDQPSRLMEYLRHVDMMVSECEEERRRIEKTQPKKGRAKRKGRKR